MIKCVGDNTQRTNNMQDCIYLIKYILLPYINLRTDIYARLL